MDERYAFLTEWYDATASLVRQYQLLFYTKDNAVEMYDIKNRKLFLKRTRMDNIKLSDLFIGANICILSRQLNFIDFGDEHTRKKLSSKTENVSERVKDTGACVVMEVMGHNAVTVFRELIGPADANEARLEAPHSIRAQLGLSAAGNNVYSSTQPEQVRFECDFFFGSEANRLPTNTAQLSGTTLCIIKPHIVQSGNMGKVIDFIIERGGYEITAMKMFVLSTINAEEFLEVYKGVMAEYPNMVTELTSGSCLALECKKATATDQSSADVQQAFREFTGPVDPEIARHLRPHTLRANFGRDKIKNAVHCTDLPEDADLEVEYFFKILDK